MICLVWSHNIWRIQGCYVVEVIGKDSTQEIGGSQDRVRVRCLSPSRGILSHDAFRAWRIMEAIEGATWYQLYSTLKSIIYAAPSLFQKKHDRSWRLCIDYRALNKIIIKDKYPILLMEDLFDMLRYVINQAGFETIILSRLNHRGGRAKDNRHDQVWFFRIPCHIFWSH